MILSVGILVPFLASTFPLLSLSLAIYLFFLQILAKTCESVTTKGTNQTIMTLPHNNQFWFLSLPSSLELAVCSKLGKGSEDGERKEGRRENEGTVCVRVRDLVTHSWPSSSFVISFVFSLSLYVSLFLFHSKQRCNYRTNDCIHDLVSLPVCLFFPTLSPYSVAPSPL